MANLTELTNYESGIYQIEVTDPVQGGPDGISNLQAKQLANRTNYLKTEQDVLRSDVDVLQSDMATTSDIIEYILTQDPASFTQALHVYWRHSALEPKIELFGNQFLIHQPDDFPIIRAALDDDSIDVEGAQNLIVNEDYVLETPGIPNEVVRVREIDDSGVDTLFRAMQPVLHTRSSGRLTKVAGAKSFGKCTFNDGGIYITNMIFNEGLNTINVFLKRSALSFSRIYVRDFGSHGEWEELVPFDESGVANARLEKDIIHSMVVNSDQTVELAYNFRVSGSYSIRVDFILDEEQHPGVTEVDMYYLYIKNTEAHDLEASIDSAGMVVLSNNYLGDSEVKATTEKAVSGAITFTLQNLPISSTSSPGIVRLTNAFNSVAENRAVTARALKEGLDSVAIDPETFGDASDTLKGVTRYATTAEANNRALHNVSVTPLGLSTSTAPLVHTHTHDECGAASSGHTHSPVSINAADRSHTHGFEDISGLEDGITPASIGAATATHQHTVEQLSNATSSDRTRKTTISTANASGGSDGDVWFTYV